MDGVHGHFVEKCETEFRFSECIRPGSVQTRVLWKKLVKYMLGKVEKEWKGSSWRIWFQEDGGRDKRLSSTVWAGNF